MLRESSGMTKNNESSIRTLMRAEDVRVAQRAIADGDVNGLDKSKRSPLFYAVTHGELGLVSELISHGANPNSATSMGRLHFILQLANLDRKKPKFYWHTRRSWTCRTSTAILHCGALYSIRGIAARLSQSCLPLGQTRL